MINLEPDILQDLRSKKDEWKVTELVRKITVRGHNIQNYLPCVELLASKNSMYEPSR